MPYCGLKGFNNETKHRGNRNCLSETGMDFLSVLFLDSDMYRLMHFCAVQSN